MANHLKHARCHRFGSAGPHSLEYGTVVDLLRRASPQYELPRWIWSF